MSVLARGLILHCRVGFEKEVAAEAAALCAQQGLGGFVRTQDQSALARFEFNAPCDWTQALTAPFPEWVFARERYAWIMRIENLPQQDRAGVIAQQLAAAGLRAARVSCEFADTNEAKEMSGFLRRFTPHLEKALTKAGVLKRAVGATAAQAPERPTPEQASARGDIALERDVGGTTLHLLFEDSSACDVGLSHAGDASPWPMGVPRLRMPREAPSRSTLKLAEAFLALMNETERTKTLRAGLRAVDLGAAPGGWTLQLAQRGLHVAAIDNGPLAEGVLATGMVQHVRADGFTWRPAKPVEWLVCDMVEQPARVANLIADWLLSGRCRRSIFNLKLPMKKRYDEVQRCRAIIEERLADRRHVLRMKHLYHDREEITAYLALL